jgi:hypothetical protein
MWPGLNFSRTLISNQKIWMSKTCHLNSKATNFSKAIYSHPTPMPTLIMPSTMRSFRSLSYSTTTKTFKTEPV